MTCALLSAVCVPGFCGKDVSSSPRGWAGGDPGWPGDDPGQEVTLAGLEVTCTGEEVTQHRR